MHVWFCISLSQPGSLKGDWTIFCSEGKWKSPLSPQGDCKNVWAEMLPDSCRAWGVQALRTGPCRKHQIQSTKLLCQFSQCCSHSGEKGGWPSLRLCQSPDSGDKHSVQECGRQAGKCLRGRDSLEVQMGRQWGLLWRTCLHFVI